ncbi:MAG: OmpA family protein [Steroidobacteraceae bacterium]|nr:OmpA family protein [Steroidobacteraceae bacterium]
MKQTLIAAAVAASLFALSGCETAPKTNATLEAARAAVQTAESNPNVPKYAPTELDRARKLLINAEGAAKENGPNDKDMSHYAYLATQLAHIAEQRAQEQVATARIKAGEVERQQILLTAREGEANQAMAQARNAQSQAEQARTQAEQARNEAQNAQSQMAQAQAESQRLAAESARLAAELQDMKASQTKRGIVLTLDDVLFDTGKSQLKSGADRSLDQIAAFLNENPERRVQVEGFTDAQGTDEFNLELSQKRADSVAMAIMRRGIDAQRVRGMGYGEEFPVASNDNAGSRQLNRRVEIIVSNDNSAIPGRTAGSP